MLRKIVIVQCDVGRELSLDENLAIFKQRPDFVILPEYFNVNPKLRDTRQNSLDTLRRLKYCGILAERFETILISGTAIESYENEFFNTCHVFDRNDIVGTYRKTNPTANEQKNYISPGQNQIIIEINNVRVSVLICADVLYQANFDRLRSLQPDIVFIPTTSPYRPHEHEKVKFARDNNIFIDGARRSGAYIIKCCAVGELWGGKLQGRSLVAAPWGILNRIAPQDENRERIISTTLDIADLREFRAKQRIIYSTT
ncbi:MAG: carbon-nitrogen hydrolase family protein [candidate division Zixibacteria bacterium]